MASSPAARRPCCQHLQRLRHANRSTGTAEWRVAGAGPFRTMSAALSAQAQYAKPNIQWLRRQPPKVIPDYLTPMPSHLLATMLADLESCGTNGSTSWPPQSTSSPSLTASGQHPDTAADSSPVTQSPPLTLPQGHHLVYFPIQAAPSRLAPDGADLDHSPGAHYSRRLWAGGEVVFHGVDSGAAQNELLLDGRPWTCTETIGDVRVKGTTGTSAASQGSEKVFVDVWRRYALGHTRAAQEHLSWAVEERRTLVFMNPGNVPTERRTSPSKIIKYPYEAAHLIRILPSPSHLFHFSALTFNAHAIHLDPEYARSVDGHRAPLVHGPLTLVLMLRALTRFSGRLVSRISYRNHAPLYVNEQLTVKVRPVPARGDSKDGAQTWDTWVEGPDGGLAVKGTATMAGSI